MDSGQRRLIGGLRTSLNTQYEPIIIRIRLCYSYITKVPPSLWHRLKLYHM
jgi:hypothetical protein